MTPSSLPPSRMTSVALCEEDFYHRLPGLAIIELPYSIPKFFVEQDKVAKYRYDVSDIIDDGMAYLSGTKKERSVRMEELVQDMCCDMDAILGIDVASPLMASIMDIFAELEEVTEPLFTPSGFLHYQVSHILYHNTFVLRKKTFSEEYS